MLVSETPTVDGEPDTRVPYEAVPQYRRSGIARQEKPLYFMLRPHVNLAAPQPVIDRKRGLEYDDEYSQEVCILQHTLCHVCTRTHPLGASKEQQLRGNS